VATDLSRFHAVIKAQTTADVQATLMEVAPKFDIILMPAAISDYRIENPSTDKLHRSENASLDLHLIANPDLLVGLGKAKKESNSHQLIVGFAAEVVHPGGSLIDLAKAKLARKGVDVLVANDVTGGKTFESESNSVVMVSHELGDSSSKGSKYEVANQILTYLKPLIAH
jgi:phosphopantothenoylcysteine decarboxylase/phosphopantothenate--cysteine ligase